MDRALYDIHNNFHETHWWFLGRKKVVEALLNHSWNGKHFKTGMDLGTGGGSMIELLKSFIDTVDVLEPDEKIARSLNLKYAGELKIFVSTLEQVVPKKNYQVVSLFDVLEHIENDTSALNKIYSLMDSSGYIVLTVPAYRFLWSNHDVQAKHFRRYTKTELVRKLTCAGFTVEKVTYFNTLLFPFVLLVRFLHKFLPSSNTDFSYGRGFSNRFFYYVFSFERLIVRFLNFPFGVSIFCLARKKRFF